MSALHITKDNFQKEVLESAKPVLLDFWAEWCGPCQMMLPIVEQLAEELRDVKVCKINVDEEPELAAQFRVMSIPTFKVFKEGKATASSVGAQSKSALVAMLNQ